MNIEKVFINEGLKFQRKMSWRINFHAKECDGVEQRSAPDCPYYTQIEASRDDDIYDFLADDIVSIQVTSQC